MEIDEFKKVLKDFLAVSLEGDVEIIQIMPMKKVAIKKSYLKREDKLRDFVQGTKHIHNIHKGVYHKAIVGLNGFSLTAEEAYIVIAIGLRYGLWDSSPMNIENEKMREVYIQQDSTGMLPSTTGFDVSMAMAKLEE